MKILVDTSIWVDHLREQRHPLSALLKEERVLMHEMIAGELACGNLKQRRKVLNHLSELPQIPTFNGKELIAFIAEHSIMGKGIGLVDVNLLASAKSEGCQIWTRDKNFAFVATGLNLLFDATCLEEVS